MMITDPNVARLQVADRTRRFEQQADAHRARQATRRELGLTARTRPRRVTRIRRWFAGRPEALDAPGCAPVSAAPGRGPVSNPAC